MFLFTCILELTRKKLIFKTYSGYACAEAWSLLCRIPMLKWKLWVWLASKDRGNWSAFLAPDWRWHSLAVVWASSDVTIDTRATLLCSLSSTNRNAKAYFSCIYLLQTTYCSCSIHWVIAWTTPWARFVDSRMIEDDLDSWIVIEKQMHSCRLYAWATYHTWHTRSESVRTECELSSLHLQCKSSRSSLHGELESASSWRVASFAYSNFL